jgi:hypothetical protein
MVRAIIDVDTLPQYRLTLDEADKLTFYTKDARHLATVLSTKTPKR